MPTGILNKVLGEEAVGNLVVRLVRDLEVKAIGRVQKVRLDPVDLRVLVRGICNLHRLVSFPDRQREWLLVQSKRAVGVKRDQVARRGRHVRAGRVVRQHKVAQADKGGPVDKDGRLARDVQGVPHAGRLDRHDRKVRADRIVNPILKGKLVHPAQMGEDRVSQVVAQDPRVKARALSALQERAMIGSHAVPPRTSLGSVLASHHAGTVKV